MNRDRKAQYNQLMGLQKSVQQRVLRANKMDAHRRDLRVQKWAVQRGVAQTEEVESSKQQTETTKDKNQKKKEIKKPPFRVGKVNHKYYSPPPLLKPKLQSRNGAEKSRQNSSTHKKITRATEKRLMTKQIASNNLNKSMKSSATNHLNIETQVSKLEHIRTTVNKECDSNEVTSVDSNKAPRLDETFDKDSDESPTPSWSSKVSPDREDQTSSALNTATSINGAVESTPKIESVAANNSRESSPLPPAFYSPYIVTSRGKRNARKEEQLRRGLRSINPNEIPTKETVMQNLNISIENEERTAKYFKYLLDQEVLRLTQLCDNWTNVRFEEALPEDAQYFINQAIGQTQLLLNKKFQRFRSLVENCESGKGQLLVTCSDLEGFWDMTKVEIKNCDTRFEKLDKLKANNWQENDDAHVEKLEKQAPLKKKVVPKNKSKVTSKSSGLRAFILAQKKMITQDAFNNFEIQKTDQSTPSKRSIPSSEQISSKKQSGKKHSGSFKNIISPRVAMKISQKFKTPEVQMDCSISYINSDQTPGRSILKKSEESDVSIKKSLSKVNFYDGAERNSSLLNKTLINKELAVVLEKIDKCNLKTCNSDGDKTLIFQSPPMELQGIDSCKSAKTMGTPFIPLKGKILEFDDDSVIGDETDKVTDKSSTPMEVLTPMRVLRNRTINCVPFATPSRRKSRQRYSLREIDSKNADIQTLVTEKMGSKENTQPSSK